MSSVQERLQLKRVPLDTWNIREQLCLASAVVRSGDQNWMSVSRALKTVGEPNRPPDWYSQKSCAAQYGALLEHVETPKRKKRSSEGAVETPQESILKRLTQERIVEIQKTIAEMNQQYEQLKNDITEARNPTTSDDRLRDMWAEVEAAKRARERESARRAAWLKEREERRARADRVWRPPAGAGAAQPITSASAGPPVGPPTPSSPLLTSLLKSSPVVTTPQHMPHPASVVETVSPSAGAPTLSMLLEKSGNTSPHENKHAAIEHIKSQLVQIEQQLKANSSPTPPPPPLAAPPVDIDDIEIKAEDVYAFRDVDINTPVLHAHKHLRPSLDKLVTKEEQMVPDPVEATAAPPAAPEPDVPLSLPEVPGAETVPEDMMPIDVENVQPAEAPVAPAVEPAVGAAEVLPIPIGFPEVKFPAPEIKVLGDQEKIKEEIREPEAIPLAAEKEPEEEVDVVEDAPTAERIDSTPVSEVQEVTPVAPPAPAEAPDAVSLQAEGLPATEDIPLPATDPEPAPPSTEPPLPPEPEPPLPEVKQELVEPEAVKQQEPEMEVKKEETTTEDDSKKDDDTEDSIPLTEIVPGAGAGLAPGAEPEPAAREADGEDAHTETDDDTPMELSRVEEMDGKKKRDYSRKKKPDSRTCSGSESAAEASAPESPLPPDGERTHRLWKKSVLLVYGRLCAHKYASIFQRAISDDEAPGYSVVVRRPMDLTTIKKNIEAGVIRTTSEFQRDVLLMLTNALMYNSSEHSVYQMAKDMFEEAAGQLGILVAAQAHAGLVSPPARRKRRRDSDPPAPAPPPHAAPAAHPPHAPPAPPAAKRPH